MTLTPLQTASLKQLQRYGASPRLRDRLRSSAGYGLLLLLPPYTDLDTEHTTEGRWGFFAVQGTGVPVTIIGDHVIRGLGSNDAPWSQVDAALTTAGYRLPPAATRD